jgi:hypothetical protein
VQAEEAQDALERFGEMTECLRYGQGWSCTLLATPESSSRVMGRDDRGNEVWMRRFRCVAEHWYEVETSAPRTEEANGHDAHAAIQVGESASSWRM